MKRSISLLLSVLLAFSLLTACGTDQNNNANNNPTGSNGMTTAHNTGSAANPNDNQTPSGSTSAPESGRSAVRDWGDDLRNDWDRTEDALTGEDTRRTDGTTTRQRAVERGVSYGHVLQSSRQRAL